MRANHLIATFVIGILIIGCSTTHSKRPEVSLIAQASNGRQQTIAYLHTGPNLLAVATRLDYTGIKCDFKLQDKRGEQGLTIITSTGEEDITQSKFWYDVRQDGIHKYPLANVSVETFTNFVSDSVNLNYSNFVAWQKKRGI